MKIVSFLITFFILRSFLFSADFTICSYNCGGLSDHYDYLRAVVMEKVMQERHDAEPQECSLNEKMQKLFLKMLFTNDVAERYHAEREWNEKGFQQIFERLTTSPLEVGSLNQKWFEKANKTITSYKERPIKIFDRALLGKLQGHMQEVTGEEEKPFADLVDLTYEVMAERIFTESLHYDILCLQEADYLDDSLFPDHYELLLGEGEHSKNGIAWNADRFELMKDFGVIARGHGYALLLRDKINNKVVAVASAHITGCNPYKVDRMDSYAGDHELREVLHFLNYQNADVRVVGVDSNVTSLHPRLQIFKNESYLLDYENGLEPTCTNPYQLLNTRIDWIAVRASEGVNITNISVQSIGLNSMRTNMSDHKPIAARVSY